MNNGNSLLIGISGPVWHHCAQMFPWATQIEHVWIVCFDGFRKTPLGPFCGMHTHGHGNLEMIYDHFQRCVKLATCLTKKNHPKKISLVPSPSLPVPYTIPPPLHPLNLLQSSLSPHYPLQSFPTICSPLFLTQLLKSSFLCLPNHPKLI